jgi:hypothetical protein
MYKVIISQLVIAIVLLFSSCGGRSTSEKSDRTHTHSDGTVHTHDGDHDHDHLPAGQESFTIESTEDTTDVHDHHHDHPHTH